MQSNSYRSLIVTSVLLLGSVVGCAGTKTQQTQKEEATNQWNSARAAVMYGLARDQYQTGNYDKCQQTLGEAMRLQPNNAKIHILAAKLAIEQGKLELAEKELKSAREFDPKDAEADYLSGVICQRWQKPQPAFDYYDAASTKAPNELAYVLAKAEMLVEMDRQTDALALLQDKVMLFEHSAVIRDAAGQLLVEQKKYAEAVTMLRQASILETDDETIREHLALAMFYNGQFRESSELFTRLMKIQKNQTRPEMYLAQGECLMQLHKPAEARGCFESAAQLSPSSVQAMTCLAKAALEMKDFRRAELSLKKAANLDPQSAEVQLLTGYLRVCQNKMDEALAAFEKASQLDRTDTVSVCMIGYVLEKTGHADRATQYYGQALKMKPDDEMAKQMMATVDTGE